MSDKEYSDSDKVFDDKPVKFDLHGLSESLTRVIKKCAHLALRSHVQKDGSYYPYPNDTDLTNVMEVTRLSVPGGGAQYCIIFEGCTTYKGVETFEVEVFQDLVQRKVVRTRTLKPCEGKWYTGEFTAPRIPVKWPKPIVTVPTNWFTGKQPSVMQVNWKPTSHGPTPSVAHPSSDVIANCKLNMDRMRTAERCAVLALQDYAIQVSTSGLHVIKLVYADVNRRNVGMLYSVVFIGATDLNGVATFMANVWNTKYTREVVGIKILKPQLGEIYMGNLVVPLEVQELSQFDPSELIYTSSNV